MYEFITYVTSELPMTMVLTMSGEHWYNAGTDAAPDFQIQSDYYQVASTLVSTPAPTAVAQASPAGTPGAWKLDGSLSTAAAGATIASYQWAVPGLPATTGATPTVTLPQSALPATVTLTVTDSTGQSSSAPVVLADAIKVAQVLIAPDPAIVGDTSTTATVQVRNDGAWPLSGVTSTLSAATPALLAVDGGPMPSTASLAPGASQAFTFPLSAKQAGVATLDGSASGNDGTADLSDGPVARDVTVVQAVTGTLSSNPVRPRPGTAFTVTLDAANSTGHAQSVTAGTLTSTPSQHVTISGPVPTGAVSIPDGGHSAFTYSVTATDAGSLALVVPLSAHDQVIGTDRTVQVAGTVRVTDGNLVVNSVSDAPLADAAKQADVCDTDQALARSECTLRAAIQLANARGASGQTSAIDFAVPGSGIPDIAPATAYPPITASVVIDGATQPAGWVQLDGTHLGTAIGLELQGGHSRLHGFVVNGFSTTTNDSGENLPAIVAAGPGGDTLAGNRFGTDATGSRLVGSAAIEVSGPGSVVGGDNPGPGCADPCNLIAAQVQVDAAASGTRIEGNWIGVDATGTVPLNPPGILHLLYVRPADAVVGGATPLAGTHLGNVIDGNTDQQLIVTYGQLSGNVIGLAPDGKTILNPTARQGVFASGDVVGGPPGQGNVISGFPLGGGSIFNAALIVNSSAGPTRVVGNLVGTDRSGEVLPVGAPVSADDPTVHVANDVGISVTGGAGNVVADNVVSGNTTAVSVGGDGDVDTQVTGNRVGTDATGTVALANVDGVNAIVRLKIGGTRPGGSLACVSPCNLISGNRRVGVVAGDLAPGTDQVSLIQGNFIGTNLAGTAAIPNGDGVTAYAGSITVGGSSAAASDRRCDGPCNLISGNTGYGLRASIDFNNAQAQVAGNMIGAGINGLPLGNGAGVIVDGSSVFGALRTQIGGTAPGFGNRIQFNRSAAVRSSVGRETPGDVADVRNNVMSANGTGIIVDDGLTAPPASTLSAVERLASGTRVQGQLGAGFALNANEVRYDVYGETTCQAPQDGQGLIPMGSLTRAVFGRNFDITVPAAPASVRFVDVTVTDLSTLLGIPASTGPTGPFSACLPIGALTARTTAPAAAGDTEVAVDSNQGWKPGDYAQIDVPGNPVVRKVAAIGSLIFAAPLPVAVPAGTVIEHVSPPHGDTTPPTVTVLFPWPGARIPYGSHIVPLVFCRDRGVGVQGCKAARLDTRTVGAHVLIARGWDKNGNLTTVKVRYVVTSPHCHRPSHWAH